MGSNLNFLSPVMSLELQGKDGTTLMFRSWGNRYNSVAMVDDYGEFPYLTDLSVSITGSGSGAGRGVNAVGHNISFTIQPPRNVFIRFVERFLPAMDVGGYVRAQLGYSQDGGIFTQSFVGQIQYPTVSMNADFVSMGFTCPGTTWDMGRRDGIIRADGTILDALRYILASHRSKLYYINQLMKEVELTGVAPSPVEFLNYPVSEVEAGSDFAILKKLIEVNAGLSFYRRNERVVVYNQHSQSQVTDIPVFQFGGKVDPPNGFYPIESFSNSNTQTAFAAAVRLVKSQDIDLDSKSVSTTEIKLNDPELNLGFHRAYTRADTVGNTGLVDARLQSQLITGSGPDPNLLSSGPLKLNSMDEVYDLVSRGSVEGGFASGAGDFRSDNAGRNMPVAGNDPSGRQKMLSMKRKGLISGGIEAEWVTRGNPFFLPGMEADIQGVSDLFSGRYHILEVRHTGDFSGFTTSLRGVTLGSSNREGEGTEKSPTSAAEPRVDFNDRVGGDTEGRIADLSFDPGELA